MNFLRKALAGCEEEIVYGKTALDVLERICLGLHVCCRRRLAGESLRKPRSAAS